MNLSAEEILALAVRIEENAARYYRKLSEMFSNDSSAFARMAKEEESHKKTFIKWQNRLEIEDRSEKSSDPFFELQTYLEMMADSHGGEGRATEIDHFKGDEKRAELLLRAIDMERKTVDYYLGVERVAVNAGAKEMLAKVIEEEKMHVETLEHLREEIAEDV